MQAASWDNEERRERAKVIAEQIAYAVKFKQDDNALEFGCGTGLISFNFHDKLKNITCIDTSKGMINIVNTKILQQKIKNMAAYQQDINDANQLLPMYNLIYTSMALHHVLDITATLANLYKLLKNDGYLCIVDLDEDDGSFHQLEKDFKGHNGFNQSKLKKVLAEIGYKSLESHTFYSNIKNSNGVMIPYSLFIMVGRKVG